MFRIESFLKRENIKYKMVNDLARKKKPKTVVAGKVSPNLHKVVRSYVRSGACLNQSELVRIALTDYLKRKAPETFDEIMNLR